MDEPQERPNAENCVFIGKKPTKNYVFAVQTQAQRFNEIIIKARGRTISKAVDVCLISLNRFLNGWQLKKTEIGTDEQAALEKEGIHRVSFIEITITK